MNKSYRDMIISSSDSVKLLEKMESYSPNDAAKWT